MAAYHILPYPLGYDEYVGLWLNRERVRYQNAIDTARGVGITRHNKDLPVIWFDAMTPYVACISELLFQTNADRLEARTVLPWTRRS